MDQQQIISRVNNTFYASSPASACLGFFAPFKTSGMDVRG